MEPGSERNNERGFESTELWKRCWTERIMKESLTKLFLFSVKKWNYAEANSIGFFSNIVLYTIFRFHKYYYDNTLYIYIPEHEVWIWRVKQS